MIKNIYLYRGAGMSLTRPGRKQAPATEDLMFMYPIYYHNWRNISTIYTHTHTHTHTHIYIYIYIYKTRLASKEIFSPSNKIHREVGRTKDLSAPRYINTYLQNTAHNKTYSTVLAAF
jgi:hypothetical protein